MAFFSTWIGIVSQAGHCIGFSWMIIQFTPNLSRRWPNRLPLPSFPQPLSRVEMAESLEAAQ